MPGISHLFVSAVVHGILAFFIIGWPAIAPAPEPALEPNEEEAELLTESELVTEANVPPIEITLKQNEKEPAGVDQRVVGLPQPEGTPIEDSDTAEDLSRIDFAGAPPSSTPAESTPTNEPAQQGPGLGSSPALAEQANEHGGQREPLMSSAVFDTKGLKVPPVFFTDLSVVDMDRMVRAGQGAFLAIIPPTSDDAGGTIFLVEGSVRSPARVIEASQQQLDRLSERALPVPRTHWPSVQRQLEIDYAFSAKDAKLATVTFALSNAVDHHVLQRQQEAAQSVFCRLEDMSKTVGRLIVTDHGAEQFRITQVRLKDGRVFNSNVN